MHKIFGYLLLCAGLMMIFFSVMSMYKVFADRQPVAPVVQMADLRVNTQYGPLQIPMQGANTVVNVGLFAVFMLFVLAAGGKVAAVGGNLLKNERIHDALLQLDAETLRQNEEAVKRL